MSQNNNGMKSQLTGERAETKVRDVLLDGEIFCSKYEHDRGEDLLIELEAYTHNSKAGSGPRVASLQIKGHEADPDSDLDASFTKRRLSLNHLRRWAAMPLPVFIVAVEIVDSSPIFFARAIDELLGEIAPEGLGAIEKNTITVRLPRKNDLPAFLKAEISSFYSLNAFQLSELSESVIARNHYEVISQSTRFVPPTAKVWLKDIRVLWKGAWRPAHFWATLNHIADQLQEKEGSKSTPLMATVHVYRSLKDNRDNNAIAHVSWLEDDHTDTEYLRKAIKWPKAAHWARFRFNGEPTLERLPDDSLTKEVGDDIFIQKARVIWSQLDVIFSGIKTSISSEPDILEKELNSLQEELHKLDDGSICSLGHPSHQLSILSRMMDQYVFVLSSIFKWLEKEGGISEADRKRWLRQDIELAEGHYRAFHPLVKLLTNQ